MMKTLYVLLISVILIGCLPACNTTPTEPSIVQAAGIERKQITALDIPEPDLQTVADGNNAFAFDLYQAISNGDDNLVFSPYSISLALAMVYAGAKGETAQQMADTLHWTLPQERLHPALNVLNLALANRDGEEEEDFQLHIANAVWGQKGLDYLPDYLKVLAESYGTGIQIVDYMKNATDAEKIINNWISEQTAGQIPKIVENLDPHTRLVLANAIYFNAAWSYPFIEAYTENEPFYLLDGREEEVPMMQQKNYFRYAEGSDYQAIELDYIGEPPVAMVILLPREGQFPEIEGQLTSAWIHRVLDDFRWREVILTMPRFRFDSPTLNLNETLSGMGMPLAFSDRDADFSGIIELDPSDRLFISELLHKAFIDVNEQRTEAAAETIVVVEVSVSTGPQPTPIPPVVMTIERPFIFFIHDVETGTILLLGRVMNPANE